MLNLCKKIRIASKGSTLTGYPIILYAENIVLTVLQELRR